MTTFDYITLGMICIVVPVGLWLKKYTKEIAESSARERAEKMKLLLEEHKKQQNS